MAAKGNRDEDFVCPSIVLWVVFITQSQKNTITSDFATTLRRMLIYARFGDCSNELNFTDDVITWSTFVGVRNVSAKARTECNTKGHMNSSAECWQQCTCIEKNEWVVIK